MKHVALQTFAYRTETCPDCDSAHGGYDCETCEGACEIDSQCAECSVITALNPDGLCRECSGLVQVEVLKCGGIIL